MSEEPFKATERPEPFSGGPFLILAVPESLEPLVPINATSFVREWEEMLDPLRAVRWAAEDFMGADEDWRVGDWFAEPTFTSTSLLRRVANDEKVQEAFENTAGLLHLSDRDLRLSAQVTTDGLHEPALSVLLGLVVAASVHEIGFVGRWFSDRCKADEDRRAVVRDTAVARGQDRRLKDEDERQRQLDALDEQEEEAWREEQARLARERSEP